MKARANPIIRKTLAKQWVIILIFASFLTVYGRVLDNKSLSQAGVVVGIGVDYQDGEFIVSAQSISMQSANSEGQASPIYVNTTAKAKTIMEALDAISRKLGLIVSLSHCNVLILSPSALKLDHIQLFYPLVRSMALPEQAVIISTPDDPAELLAKPIASAQTTALLTQATLIQNLGNDGLARITVKDFLADSLSLSGAVRVPYTRIIEPTEQPVSSSSSSETEYVEIEMTENLIIKGDKSFVISSKLATALNLYLINDNKDKLEIEMPSGEIMVFRVMNKSDKTKVEGMTVNYSAELNLSFIEAQYVDGNEILNCASDIILEAAGFLKNKLEANLKECFELSKAENVDLLLLQNKVYQKVGRSLKADCFQDIEFNVSYKISVKENS